MNLSENAIKILEKRYLRKGETPKDMFRRVAKAVASVERDRVWEERFLEAMINLDFLPSSPALFNLGTENPMAMACFVLPIPDHMEGILQTLKDAGTVFRLGGGCGFAFSTLRPEGALVSSTQGTSSGPISFMKIYNEMVEQIKSGGKRRGAQIAVFDIAHPDIEKFITCKKEEGKLRNFNISVAITDDFMEALEKDKEIELSHPAIKERKKKRARELFDLIVEGGYRNGEPGVLFIDTINKGNPLPKLGRITCTNPCSESLLLDYESCDLGSINLLNMVKDKEIDWEKLEKVVKIGVRFLDSMIDVSFYPLLEIEKITRANRKIGLGVMGFADMLLRLGIKYNSRKGLDIAEEVMSFIQERAHETSQELAEEKGEFPNFEQSIYWKISKRGKKFKMRNATLTIVPPTGTISLIAGVSSGIEPNYAWKYKSYRADMVMEHVHPLVQPYLDRGEKLPPYFVTTYDISPEWHVKMQATFQKYVDQGISKTVNLPQEATVEDVKKVFLLAYELGCRGVTVYRDKSREEQVLGEGGGIVPRKRPRVVEGKTEEIGTGCGSLFITINSDEKGLVDVFTTTSKSGGCPSQSEAVGRLISLIARTGIRVGEVIKQLKGIRCMSCVRRKGVDVLSCPDAIAKCLQTFLKVGLVEEILKCPDCGEELIHKEGCRICEGCGYSKCH